MSPDRWSAAGTRASRFSFLLALASAGCGALVVFPGGGDPLDLALWALGSLVLVPIPALAAIGCGVLGRGTRAPATIALSLASLAVPVLVVASTSLVLPPREWALQDSAIAPACEWAGASPLPPSATDLHVQASGNMFARDLRIRFQAPADDVRDWIARSPGPNAPTARRIEEPDGTVRYFMEPASGGAVHAEITISPDGGRVEIHSIWS